MKIRKILLKCIKVKHIKHVRLSSWLLTCFVGGQITQIKQNSSTVVADQRISPHYFRSNSSNNVISLAVFLKNFKAAFNLLCYHLHCALIFHFISFLHWLLLNFIHSNCQTQGSLPWCRKKYWIQTCALTVHWAALVRGIFKWKLWVYKYPGGTI